MKKRFVRICALCLAMVLVMLSAGCAGGKGTVPAAAVQTVNGAISERSSGVQNKSLHLIDPLSLGSPMVTSGLMQLFLDDNSFGIALYEKTREKFWYAMPTSASSGYDYSAATVTLDVLYGNTLYKLNSQDDCMQYRNVACDTFGDEALSGLRVTYILTAGAEAAQKVSQEKIFDDSLSASDFARTDIVYQVRVTYELQDGNLYVSADWKNLSGNPNAVVCDLGLLPFFGASSSGAKNDFFLLPDGCGTLVHTALQDPGFSPMNLRVYGDDPSAPAQSDVIPALFPAFAAKQGDNAFAVILEQGDSIATFHAERASGAHGFNTVSTHFMITQTLTAEKNGKSVTYVSKTPYRGKIRMCVRLLGGANADLDGIAAACREQFMRMGYLSTDTLEREEYLPFHLSVVGAASVGAFRPAQILTSFDQAQDLLNRMKSKGINNADVRYLGALRGGMDASAAGKLRLARRMGGQKDFRVLSAYVTAQGHSLYLDASLLAYSAGNRLGSKAALNIESSSLTASVTAVDRVYTRTLSRLSALEDNVIGLLTDAQQMTFDGFCVQDASSILYSDFSEGYTDRAMALQTIQENLPALSTDKLLMVDTGNFYAIRYADCISGLPQTSNVPERAGVYTCVPFVQMILHGTLDYAGVPINLSQNPVSARLRSVEYGCCPSYAWCFSRSGGEKLCYEDQLNDAVEFYQSANEVLADLRDARIVDNTVLLAGVHVTEYDNGARIYVNYTGNTAVVGNIRIEPFSFLRIG